MLRADQELNGLADSDTNTGNVLQHEEERQQDRYDEDKEDSGRAFRDAMMTFRFTRTGDFFQFSSHSIFQQYDDQRTIDTNMLALMTLATPLLKNTINTTTS